MSVIYSEIWNVNQCWKMWTNRCLKLLHSCVNLWNTGSISKILCYLVEILKELANRYVYVRSLKVCTNIYCLAALDEDYRLIWFFAIFVCFKNISTSLLHFEFWENKYSNFSIVYGRNQCDTLHKKAINIANLTKLRSRSFMDLFLPKNYIDCYLNF